MDIFDSFGLFDNNDVYDMSSEKEQQEMKETFGAEGRFGSSGLKTKTMSLATGLNRLNVTRRPSFCSRFDDPDGEIAQTSFLHSKYVAESSIDLTHSGHQLSSSSENSQEDVTKKTTFEQKTKQSKLSKGFMEFISMGDPIGYADKKIAKSLAALNEVTTKDLNNMSSENLKNDTEEIIVVHVTEEEEYSEQNSTSPAPTPEMRRRKKTTNKMNNDVKERRKTVASNQSLSLMPDKEKERRKTTDQMFMEERRGEKSKKASLVVRPFQPNEENKDTITDIPPQNLPPLPEGKKTIDIDLNIGVDRAFELFFTENDFYKNWIHDPRRPGEPKNLRIPPWEFASDSKKQEREVTYELFQDFVITKALINVTVKQSQTMWTQPGSVYGVDNKITNKGPPLADSFVLKEHIRISSKGEGRCNFVIVANVEFLKFSLLKGRIESETWAGVTKGAEILEEYFRKVDNSIDRVINNRDILEHEATDVRQETAQKIAHVGIGHLRNTSSSDIIQQTAVAFFVFIIFILFLFILALNRLVTNLERIDERLGSIEELLIRITSKPK